MLTCFLTINQILSSLCFSLLVIQFALYLQSHPHSNNSGFDHLDAELCHFTCTSKFGYVIQLSGISKGHNLYFGAFNVNVSVFNMSFPRADVKGLGLVRAAEEADRYYRSILFRLSVIFSACHSLLDLRGLINSPGFTQQVAELQGFVDLLQDVHSKDSLTSPQTSKK